MKHAASFSAAATFSAIAVSAVLLSACVTTTLPHDRRKSPCNDSTFVQLQQKQLADMTEREYEYFKEKERACNEYKQMILETDRNAQGLKEAVDRRVYWGIGMTAALLLLLAGLGAAAG